MLKNKSNFNRYFFMFLCLCTLATGCSLLNQNGSSDESVSSITASKANLNVNIVLPKPNNNTLAANVIRSAANKIADVTITLTVVKPGVANSKLIVLIKKVTPNANGEATANFSNVPEGIAIARLKLTNANISGWTDFHGASDIHSGENSMDISPAGSKLQADILASVIQDAITNDKIVLAANNQVVTTLKNALSTINTQTDNPYTNAFNLLVTQVAPSGLIKLVYDNSAQTLTGMNGSVQAWQKTYSAIWDAQTVAALGINASNMRIARIVRQGFDTNAMVEWRDATNGYSVLTTHTSADGARQQLFANYGKFDQVVPVSNTVFIVGGYSIKNSCPALYKWDTTKSAYPANSSSDPDNLTWSKYFTTHTYTTVPTTGSAIGNISSDDSKNFTITVNLPDGTIRVYKADIDSGTFTEVVPIVTPNISPIISITSPAVDAVFTSDQIVTISTNASDTDGSIAKVEIFSGNTQIATLTSAPWTYSWSGMATESHNLTAKAYDDKGFSSISSPVKITVNPVTGNQDPTVALSAPTANSNYNTGQAITLTANASDTDGTIAKVEFYDGATLLNTDTSSPYSYSWSGATAGNHSLTAKAYDDKGAVKTSTAIVITVNQVANQDPTVALSAPTANSNYNTGQAITLTANASDTDGTIAKVEFYDGATLLNTDTSSPYSYSWSGATAGSHSLTAKAYDDKGAVKTSTVITINVNQVATFQSDLIITEVSSSKYSNTPRWFEVYNPTSSNKDLSNYYVKANYIPAAGGNIGKVATFNISSLTLAPGKYAVVRIKIGNYLMSGPGLTLLQPDNSGNVAYWSQRGYINLVRTSDDATMDFLKWGNIDSYNTSPDVPTGAWTGDAVALSPIFPEELGYSLARNVGVNDSNSASEWTIVGFATPGAINDVIDDTDADGDGIPDSNEASGKTFAGMPVYDWGARPGQKDIFIHIDYMDPAVADNALAVTPNRIGFDRMVAGFAAKQFTIHIDVGNYFGSGVGNYNLDNRSHKVGYIAQVSMDPNDGVKTIYDYKAESMPVYKTPIFHYCLLSNKIFNTTASGLGEINGNDFIVAVGGSTFSNDTEAARNYVANDQGTTIMHELGHNLGLRHGGDEDLNYKPNYLSVMNYLYGTGVPTPTESSLIAGTNVPRAGDRYYHKRWSSDGFSSSSIWKQYFNNSGSSWEQLHNNVYGSTFVFDYSDGTSSNLDENSLNESAGLGRNGSAGVDWNGDGDVADSGYSMNINPDGDNNKTILHDWNDWGAINIHFFRQSSGSASIRASIVSGHAQPRNDYLCDEFQKYIVCER